MTIVVCPCLRATRVLENKNIFSINYLIDTFFLLFSIDYSMGYDKKNISDFIQFQIKMNKEKI